MNIGLVLTFGMSLRRWEQLGILQRELTPYLRLRSRNITTIIFTYGDVSSEQDLADLYGVRLFFLAPLTSTTNFLPLILLESAIVLFFSRLPNISLVRSNQLFGAWACLVISRRLKIPSMLRSGYELNSFWRRTYRSRLRHLFAFCISIICYRSASFLEFTSLYDLRYVRRFFAPSIPSVLRPNWINTSVFKPLPKSHTIYSSLTVGRLTQQKSHLRLLEALAQSAIDTKSLKPLLFIGTGPCKSLLQEFAWFHSIPLVILDSIDNEELPSIYSQCDFYTHTSSFEGHPKALLEAISAAMPVLSVTNPRLQALFPTLSNPLFLPVSDIPYALAGIASFDIPTPRDTLESRAYIENHYSLDARVASLISDILLLTSS